ncbi:hypothetical protein X798_02253 [Onchocerca flexuosa]|uniref:Uncharacterized protein n=2 Tax=Onchocerca flexuosa TaxID=387005 RepID=A0A183H1E9_9BILA|nr:hypothetical protein X798_02253 [Onchocerca flexuosa]VDO29073.1 unnamed protein product [Onchocerca flexuosa]
MLLHQENRENVTFVTEERVDVESLQAADRAGRMFSRVEKLSPGPSQLHAALLFFVNILIALHCSVWLIPKQKQDETSTLPPFHEQI